MTTGNIFILWFMELTRKYRHGNVRAEALKAARAVVESDGTASLSLRRVARDVGVSHAALYRHFADRESLLAELGVEALTQLAREQVAAFDRHLDPTMQVDAVARAYFRFALREPGLYRIAFVIPRKTDFPPLRAAADAAERVPLLALDALAKAGMIRAADTGLLAPILWALVHGFSTLAIDGQLTEGKIAIGKGSAMAIERTMLDGVRRILGLPRDTA